MSKQGREQAWIRQAIKTMCQRGIGELNATRCLVLEELITDAELVLQGACCKKLKRTHAEVIADIERELAR
jgi:hypothetical protein